MSTSSRHNLVECANLTDESQTFKKAHQTVGRPPVTERDIHEQYMQDPPHNLPSMPNSDKKTLEAKEGGQEETGSKQDGILGNEPLGKTLRQSALEEIVTESSIHPGNPSS